MAASPLMVASVDGRVGRLSAVSRVNGSACPSALAAYTRSAAPALAKAAAAASGDPHKSTVQ
jgi:hypothetical protein